MLRPLHPFKDQVGKANVPNVGFQLVYKDTRIQRDPAMVPQKGAEAGQVQLSRSFFR